MDRRGLWLLSSLFALGCRETAEPSRRELCVAFANSVAVNNATLELATQQYASGARAMEKWEQRDVTAAPEQDPSGEYSDAGARARRYRDAGYALCSSVVLRNWELQQLALLTHVPETVTAIRTLADFSCTLTGPSVVGKAKERAAFDRDWARQRSELQQNSAAAVEACFEKLGGTHLKNHGTHDPSD